MERAGGEDWLSFSGETKGEKKEEKKGARLKEAFLLKAC